MVIDRRNIPKENDTPITNWDDKEQRRCRRQSVS